MARPWDTAEDDSLWSITGAYPGGKHTFTSCVATVISSYIHGSDEPLFVFVGALAQINEPIAPAWITRAEPLLLVHRDEPGTAYWQEDQVWLSGGGAR